MSLKKPTRVGSERVSLNVMSATSPTARLGERDLHRAALRVVDVHLARLLDVLDVLLVDRDDRAVLLDDLRGEDFHLLRVLRVVQRARCRLGLAVGRQHELGGVPRVRVLAVGLIHDVLIVEDRDGVRARIVRGLHLLDRVGDRGSTSAYVTAGAAIATNNAALNTRLVCLISGPPVVATAVPRGTSRSSPNVARNAANFDAKMRVAVPSHPVAVV